MGPRTKIAQKCHSVLQYSNLLSFGRVKNNCCNRLVLRPEGTDVQDCKIWLPCCNKISIKLVVAPMEYILSAHKWRSGEVLMNLFIYKNEYNLQKNM